MKNEDLKPIYESQELNFHSGFNESDMIVHMLDSWQGLDVLEIGCGHGHLASILSYAGASIIAQDYSAEQIQIAKEMYPKGTFTSRGIELFIDHADHSFDVVVMQGVLEHLDEPWQELDKIMENLLKPGGTCCLSVPHWVNPRGYVYHALRLLFDAKMSLTDLHFFLLGDFIEYCEKRQYHIKAWTCEVSWASGEEMIADFRERLPKAIDKFCPTCGRTVAEVELAVDIFLKFLEKMLPAIPAGEGACLGVKISK